MDIELRVGRADDLDSIAPWTRDTFEWGDYIPDRYLTWLDDPSSEVLVCVDDHDSPLALAHVLMASSTEAWIEGARVHPDHRRSGLGTALNHAGVEWARERGARVIRLAVEGVNEAARSQVEKLGYRKSSRWVAGSVSPDPGFRVPPRSRLRHADPADLDAAWTFWATSELSAAGRELLCEGWLWRSAGPDDLKSATSQGRFFQSPHGWVVFRDFPQLQTTWLASTAEDLPGLIQGVLGHAAVSGAPDIVMKIPAVDWAAESLRREGFGVNEIIVFYKPV